MSPEEISGFPLFPLGLVALPTEIIPLHIFEERYLTMIDECLRTGKEFGILWLSGDELKEVGCACRVDRVTERLSDGRLNIMVQGTRPFRLLERQDGLPYPAGRIEFLDDEEEPDEVGASNEAHELYADLVEQATDRVLEGEELQEMGAYEMAATVDFGTDAKQQLLELRSETSRLRMLVLLLRAALKRLELIERAQARARSNGKVRFG